MRLKRKAIMKGAKLVLQIIILSVKQF